MKRYTRYEFNVRQHDLWRYFSLDLISYICAVLVYFQERYRNTFGTETKVEAWRIALFPLRLFYMLNLH